MTRRPATLTAAFVRTVSKPGVYGDGRGSRGLSLRVHLMKSGRLSRTHPVLEDHPAPQQWAAPHE